MDENTKDYNAPCRCAPRGVSTRGNTGHYGFIGFSYQKNI